VKKLRVLFLGLGSIGRRHARLIQSNFPHELVALRSHHGQEPNDLGVAEISSWDEVDARAFDVAFITNPTFLHVENAQRCAERGLHLFMEKPVDCALSGLEKLLETIRLQRLTTYVAYPLRFHPVVRALKKKLEGKTCLHANMVCASYLPHWRPKQDHRKSYASMRDKGGGVFLEMSHELDLAQYLFGPVLEITGKLNRSSDLTVDSDDCADLILRHHHTSTNVHLNLFSRQRRRFIEVDLPDGYLRADLCQPKVTGLSGDEAIHEDFTIESDSMYVSQLKYFFANIGLGEMENSLPEASPLFRTMIEFRESQNYGNTHHHLRPGRVTGS
jgi:predicted dehydrogenase